MSTRDKALWVLTLEHISQHPNDLTKVLSEHSGLSRQAINVYIKKWILAGRLTQTGINRKPEYRLQHLEKTFDIDLTQAQREEDIFNQTIRPYLSDLQKSKPNVYDMCYYSFTEMVNNAIDHSEGSRLVIFLKRTLSSIELFLLDNGEGIFKRIQRLQNLSDPRQSLQKLSTGKFTTDPSRHTGQGIFFTSRLCDRFAIFSDNLIFSHDEQQSDDWLLTSEKEHQGTSVFMEITLNTDRTLKQLFDQYANETDYGFDKTVVPLRMGSQGGSLVSRSEAKRIASQFSGFKRVILDFRGVDFIGQAFADELFRVFQNQYPNITITPLYANDAVSQMIQRALLETAH
jgi:anti-sigma regulatory factor (Ser/Thr protein kinase)